MVSFKEFYLLEITKPHHRGMSGLRRLANRHGMNIRNGKHTGVNMVAKRYTNPNDPNFNQNAAQKTGVIAPNEAEEIISNHGLSKEKLMNGHRLGMGKHPFEISFNSQTKQYIVTPKTN
jgi:hypothetical protein